MTTDIRELESIKDTCNDVLDYFGSVDILVNSAGTAVRSPISNIEESEWNKDIDILLNGIFRSCKIFSEVMSTGSIVNISSIAANQGRDKLSSYCSAKAGVNAFTRVAASEFGPKIRVNAIEPGFVMTPLTRDTYPEGSSKRERINQRTATERVADREEIVGIITYLGSEAGSYTTGEVIRIDGGFVNGAFEN